MNMVVVVATVIRSLVLLKEYRNTKREELNNKLKVYSVLLGI